MESSQLDVYARLPLAPMQIADPDFCAFSQTGDSGCQLFWIFHIPAINRVDDISQFHTGGGRDAVR